MLNRLETSFGISGDALQWMRSYLENRFQSGRVDGCSSDPCPLLFGMPQGSVVGPYGFTCYSKPLGAICQQHSVSYHLYADDTQIYLSFSPNDQNHSIQKLEACVKDIREWMLCNFLKLNDAKTEFLVLGTPHLSAKLPKDISITIGNAKVSPSQNARNIGAIFDSNLQIMLAPYAVPVTSTFVTLARLGPTLPRMQQKNLFMLSFHQS